MSEVVCHFVSVKPQINRAEYYTKNVPADAFFLYAKWKVESADVELAAKSLTGENSRLLLLSLIKPNLLLIYGGLPKLRARLTLVLGIIMILKSTALEFLFRARKCSRWRHTRRAADSTPPAHSDASRSRNDISARILKQTEDERTAGVARKITLNLYLLTLKRI